MLWDANAMSWFLYVQILFQASGSEKKKAASNYYSTTYTVDELMQYSKSMKKKKESYSPLNWDPRIKQYVDTLVDAIKKDQAHARTVKKEEVNLFCFHSKNNSISRVF